MAKIDKLLSKIRASDNPVLDLTDFAVESKDLEALVNGLNRNSVIKTLILNHNNLSDESAEPLSQLQNIQALDISYNNFTLIGIERLRASLNKRHPGSFKIYYEHNNTQAAPDPLIFTSVSEVAGQPRAIANAQPSKEAETPAGEIIASQLPKLIN